MGLDTVELVMEVEETFGIKIEDEEYGFLHTVQDLNDLIIRKRCRSSGGANGTERRESPPCFSLVAFVRLRRALTERFDVPRSLVRPATHLEDVFPADERMARWADLASELGLKLPTLKRPRWMRRLLMVRTVTVVTCLVLLATLGLIGGAAFLASLSMAGLMFWASWWLMTPFASALEPAFCTVGGLSKTIVALNYRTFIDRYPVARDGDVMTDLIRIISETLCIPVDEIRPEMSFIDDLKCD